MFLLERGGGRRIISWWSCSCFIWFVQGGLAVASYGMYKGSARMRLGFRKGLDRALGSGV